LTEPAVGAAAPPEPAWGFGDVVVTLVGSIVLATVVVSALTGLESGAWSSPTAKAWASVLALVCPWPVLGGWPLLAARRKGNGPVLDFGLRLGAGEAVLGVAGGLAALATAAVVAAVQVKIMGHDFSSAVGDVAQNVTSASRGALVVLALLTVLGAPVVEELAFRGLTFGSFRKRLVPVTSSVVWTTVMFALFHFEPVRLPVLLVLGGFLGVVRARTGSTAASMVTHATINLPAAVTILAMH
jgi:uncharacterized protein